MLNSDAYTNAMQSSAQEEQTMDVFFYRRYPYTDVHSPQNLAKLD